MATFTKLPPEMRNGIYDMLLTGPAPDLSVLTACRLLHGEASSYYYQNNVFTVYLPCEATSNAAILAPIPDKYVRYLRHLTINMCLSISRVLQADCARRIEALADTGGKLSILTINLTSNTSRLLSTRVDDSVLSEDHPITHALEHLLSSGAVHSVCINLDTAWFAPGLATRLLHKYENRLEICMSTSPERALLHQTTRTCLHNLGLDAEEAEDLQPPSCDLAATPSSLGSALSELDQFSPADFLDLDEQLSDGVKIERADSLLGECRFGMHDGVDGEEEELTAEDDVEDEDMGDVDDLEAIIGNLEEVAHWRANEADVCYMTNFAPEMLGRWVGGSA